MILEVPILNSSAKRIVERISVGGGRKKERGRKGEKKEKYCTTKAEKEEGGECRPKLKKRDSSLGNSRIMGAPGAGTNYGKK